MRIPELTPSTIRAHTSGGSYERGRRYYEEGAVHLLGHDGGVLSARVQGQQPLPYDVRVNYEAEGITGATCSCPYHQGKWCKHIAAVLLAALDHVEGGGENEVIEELFGEASRDELLDVLKRMARRDPRIVRWLKADAP